jgi:multidrug efflux pump subunit AcrB
MKKSYEIKGIAGHLAKTFLHNPLTPLLGIFILIVGYVSLVITPREEDPQIAISGGTIMVALPGSTPKEIERVIVKPLQRKIKEIQGVEHIYGVATEDVGIVNVMYSIGEDKESSNLKLYDKVMQNMNSMPKGAMQPLVMPFDIDIDIPILTMAFYLKENAKIDEIALYKKVDEIRNRLALVENIAKSEIKGEAKEQYNIEVDLGRLSGFNISLGQVATALESLMINVPNVKNRTKEGKLVVFGIKNALEDEKDLQNLIIAQYGGSPIYLKDIASVSRGRDIQNHKNAQISFKVDGKFTEIQNQVTLTLSKLRGTNAVVIADDVLQIMDELKDELNEEGIGYLVTRNYGTRANKAVNNLVMNLIVSIIIIFVLLVFTLGFRESVIVTFLVPAILAVTLFIAYLGDQTIKCTCYNFCFISTCLYLCTLYGKKDVKKTREE